MSSAARDLARLGWMGVLLLFGITGCSKKVTAPANSRPVPEGQQNGQLLMTGWHEQASVWFVVADPATPFEPGDDVLADVGADFYADASGVRTATFDGSAANQLEAFRVGADGNIQPIFDFLIQPSVRFIGENLELFEFEDFSPGAAPKYVGRGARDGVVAPGSPVSNFASAAATCDDNMNFIPPPKLFAGDSVLKIRYTDDPRAAFVIVEISDASDLLGTGLTASTERRTVAIPSPLLPGTRPLASQYRLLLPPGAGDPGLSYRLTSRLWPLFFYIRVTAFDAQGRMVNRVNDYLHTQTSDAGVNFHWYEPMGGAVEVLDPYPSIVDPVPTPDVLTRDVAFARLHSYGGAAPRQVNYLSGSVGSRARTAPAGAAIERALEQLGSEPAFSARAFRESMAGIRRAIEQRSTGPSGAGAKSARPATPEPTGR